MSLALLIVSWLLLGLGSLFVVIGGIGLVRMPDFFTRLHPAGLTDTMAAGLLLVGLAFQADSGIVVAKLLLIAVFLFFTTPTSSHATARAALAAGLAPDRPRERAPAELDEG